MDSSVIFLVVIGLWAAYLVPHWLRRREDLSASRSADRFSAAMRVLTRRSVVSEPTESLETRERPRTSAYVLTPARDTEAGAGADPGPAAPADAVGHAARAGRPRLLAARALATLLLLGLLAVPTLAGLAVAGLLPTWAAAPAPGLVLVLLVALRVSVRRRRRSAGTTAPVPVPVPVPVGVPVPVPVQDGEDDGDAVLPREELFDEARHTAREEQARIRRLAEEALRAADVPYREPEPGEWTPVAVPLPAYLLKPHARPAWQPMLQVEQSPPSRRPDVDEDDIPTYAPPTRRAAGA